MCEKKEPNNVDTKKLVKNLESAMYCLICTHYFFIISLWISILL